MASTTTIYSSTLLYYTCEQKQGKGVFFSQERVKQGTYLLVQNAIFQKKGVVLSKFIQILLIYSTYMGGGSKLRQSPTKSLFMG